MNRQDLDHLPINPEGSYWRSSQERDEISRQVQEWLDNGNKPEVIPFGVSAHSTPEQLSAVLQNQYFTLNQNVTMEQHQERNRRASEWSNRQRGLPKVEIK